MPSSPSYVRKYQQELVTAKRRGDYKNKLKRDKARRVMVKAGVVHKGDGKDVDHRKALSEGGSNARENLRAIAASANRSYPRTSKGAIKK